MMDMSCCDGSFKSVGKLVILDLKDQPRVDGRGP